MLRKLAKTREPILIALENIRVHKLRTFLTLLGIILSVSTLIIVISLIEGTNNYISDTVANLGANVFLVNQVGLVPERKDFLKALRRNRKISYEDFEALRDNMVLALRVGLEVRRSGSLRFGTDSLDDVDVRGVTSNIGDMDVEEPLAGRYITDSDDLHRSDVALIGADVTKKFFLGRDPLGRVINIDGRPFEIVGVAKPIGTVLGQSQDNFIYVPVRTFMKIYGANANGMSINVQARSPELLPATQEEARTLMRARRHLAPGDSDSFGILAASSLMDLWHQLTGAIASAMVGVVSVFLVIGGVVIMNVMLTSVTERTREIGIRKSLGARKKDILMQFIFEASIMSALGGVAGVLFAGSLGAVVRATTPVPMSTPLYAVVLAVFISTVVGLFFGIYPARKAANLDPIEAMRQEV
jgi:putative ABC transport system permease protein